MNQYVKNTCTSVPCNCSGYCNTYTCTICKTCFIYDTRKHICIAGVNHLKTQYHLENHEDNITLRDNIAIAAMQGLVSNGWLDRDVYDVVASIAYNIADAMLKFRQKK